MGTADQRDIAVGVGLLCSAAQIHLSAQYLLDTGRVDQAMKLSDAATIVHQVYSQVVPAIHDNT